MIRQILKNKLVQIIVILLSIKIVLQLYFYHLGFVAVSADEYLRGITAARWALVGDLPTVLYTGTWMPFELYLNGLSLMIWDNVIWTPRITVFIFSCFLLVYFLKIVQYLYNLYSVTLIAGLFLIFNPWFLWLSGTPMLDIYYLAPFTGGLFYFLKWTNTNSNRYIVISTLLFAFSTGFHFQSWILVNMVNLAACYFIWEIYKQKKYKHIFILIGFFIGNNLFIFIYLVAEMITTGEFLHFIGDHTVGTKLYYEGYEVGLLQKLYYYPRLVATWGNLIWIFLPIGLYWLGARTMKTTKLFPFAIGVIGLVMFSIFNLFSVPASAAPGRYALPFIMLFIPYSALGIYALFNESGYFTNISLRRVSAVTLIACILFANFALASNFVSKTDKSAIKVGYYLNSLLESENADSTTTAMLELAYWDFLKIKLSARKFAQIRLDRDFVEETAENIANRIPSIFLIMEDKEILQHLQRGNTRFIVVKDEKIKHRLKNLDFIHKFKELDNWDFYRVDLGRFN